MSNQNRLTHFDVAKGIGIILVIVGHTSLANSFGNLIYSFHMPLFFLISGYFLSSNGSLLSFIIKKSKQLLLPYLYTAIAGLILMLFLALVTQCGDLSFFTIVKERTLANIYGLGWYYDIPIINRHIQMAGTIWFLPSLFVALLAVRLAQKFSYPIVFIVMAVCIAYCSARHIMLPMSFQAGVVASIFVYIGYIAKKTNYIYSKSFNSWILPLSAICLWGYSVFKIGYMCISMCNFSNILINIVAAICMSYIVLRVSFIICKISILKKFFSYIGRATLFLLCVHACTQAALWQFSPEYKNLIDIPILPEYRALFIIISPFIFLVLKDAMVYMKKNLRTS